MNKRGFSLIEIIVAIGVFLLFSVGIYSGIQFTFKAVYASRLRILEIGILNEQIEIIRNMPFADVGVVNGSPAGVLPREEVITRNGIQFQIIRTIRNLDDDFDGSISLGNDTSPADYKLAEAEIRCLNCGQQNPVRLSTLVAPKYLEGNTNNGALFIEVFDSNAVAVPGADVHVAATAATSTIDITDATNNSGRVSLVDLPPGVGIYDIAVSKSGYTTDRTVTSSLAIPNPVKPWASVVAQTVTTISFWIDRVADISVNTKNSLCQSAANVPVSFLGTKLIGVNPDVAIASSTVSTNAQGQYQFTGLIWDAYGLKPESYDLIGSIPTLPVVLPAGASQTVDLIVGADTADSLLVTVLDSITRQPVALATVTATTTGFSDDKSTGLGAIAQNDWAGGGGQTSMSDPMRYWSDDGRTESNQPAGDIVLRTVGNHYMASGELESSTFDLGVPANLVSLTFGPIPQPPETGSTPIRFQIATDNTATPVAWNYLGPDGTSATYYDLTTPSINSIHNGNRYLRYKVYLSTADSDFTPALSDVSLSYTVSCTPPGQAYFGSLAPGDYTVAVSKSGYQTSNQTVTVSGDTMLVVELAAQ